MNQEIIILTSEKLNIKVSQTEAVISMLQEGATIPFIARYRKEQTGGLDEEQIRTISVTYEYENKLLQRKEEVIRLITEKDKMTPELEQTIMAAKTLTEVEDLYLPYKEKKKTRATAAIAKGLEPLADFLLTLSNIDPVEKAKEFLTEEVTTTEDALNGAKDIIAERVSDDADIRGSLRGFITRTGKVVTSIKKDAVDEFKTYELYYEHSEPVKWIPSHRVLAINRAEKEDIIKVKLEVDDQEFINNINAKIVKKECPSSIYIKEAIADSYKRLLYPSIEREIRTELTDKAHEQAIDLFSKNLEQLLLTPPLKGKMMLGLDPAFRTGIKMAVINKSGDFITKDVIYPNEKFKGEVVSPARRQEAKIKMLTLIKKYNVELIAIGNGTASRETEEFVAETIKENNLDVKYIIVSEAGASVYSASELAKKEFPDLVVEERSAISIARRVIDPLAELIKIDPKSIGVGQYQHDVNQTKLSDSLEFTVSKVVNSVGVNVNSASAELLSYVSGLNKKTANSIIAYRQENGFIKDRKEISKVKGIGAKSFEQAIGFLKILESDNPLDKTFIHPENYKKVITMINDLGLQNETIGSEKYEEVLSNLDIKEASSKYDIGELTLEDIKNELLKPLRDVRDSYPIPTLKSDVLHLEDLKEGMELEGTVRSVVDFGAFVDIGLKNDGMIHKSKMSNKKINHPLDVVSVGDIVKVYVLEIQKEKNRVALTLLKEKLAG